MAKQAKKIRLNLEIPVHVRESLDALQERSHASSLTEVIRKALALLDLYLEQRESGGQVIFRSKKGTDEVLKVL
jgi:hypothetical protein